MSERCRKWLFVLLAAVFAVSAWKSVCSIRDNINAEAAKKEAMELALPAAEETLQAQQPTQEPTEAAVQPPTEEPEPLPPPTEPETVWVPVPVEDDPVMEELTQISLESLREKNPEVVGWIRIPNLKIDYPIVQGTDNQYYLSHTWDNQSNRAGSIFLEATNSADFSEFHTILYGHNMASGAMFGNLHNYTQSWWLENNPYVYLATDEGVLRYEVYSTYKADVTGDAYLLRITDPRMQQSFIQFTCDSSEIDTGIVPEVTDRILTLSTCIGDYSYRRVVHARLVMTEAENRTTALPIPAVRFQTVDRACHPKASEGGKE